MSKYFIIGTDTNIGKTYTCIKLLKYFNKQGLKTIGIKPVATGCLNGLNDDALLLQQHSSIKLDYTLINPFAFTPAVSPNIACNDLTSNKIWNSLKNTLKTEADVYIIEGVGGFLAPISSKETMADLVIKFKDIEIILVVGIRLGCLNHTLLTYQAIISRNLKIKGWIANIIDPSMEAIDENISTIKNYIQEPCLKVIPYDN